MGVGNSIQFNSIIIIAFVVVITITITIVDIDVAVGGHVLFIVFHKRLNYLTTFRLA